jgi:hypothetical protein
VIDGKEGVQNDRSDQRVEDRRPIDHRKGQAEDRQVNGQLGEARAPAASLLQKDRKDACSIEARSVPEQS